MPWDGIHKGRERKEDLEAEGFVCWLPNIPATRLCISGTNLLRQLYVLPRWDRSCRFKPSTSPSHRILTPGQPVPALILYYQPPGRVAIEIQIFKSVAWTRLRKIPTPQVGIKLQIFAPDADALTARPMRQLEDLETHGDDPLKQRGIGWTFHGNKLQMLSHKAISCPKTGVLHPYKDISWLLVKVIIILSPIQTFYASL